MDTNNESVIRDLVAKVARADRETHAHGALDQSLRTQLIAEMEACLVDRERLRRYLRVLQEALKDQLRYDDAACLENERQLRVIAVRGLVVLENAELTRLALNPIALCVLSDHIVESVFTDYWTEVAAQAYTDQSDSANRSTDADGQQSAILTGADASIEAMHRVRSWAELVDLGIAAFRAAAAGLGRSAGKVVDSMDLPRSDVRQSAAPDARPESARSPVTKVPAQDAKSKPPISLPTSASRPKGSTADAPPSAALHDCASSQQVSPAENVARQPPMPGILSVGQRPVGPDIRRALAAKIDAPMGLDEAVKRGSLAFLGEFQLGAESCKFWGTHGQAFVSYSPALHAERLAIDDQSYLVEPSEVAGLARLVQLSDDRLKQVMQDIRHDPNSHSISIMGGGD